MKNNKNKRLSSEASKKPLGKRLLFVLLLTLLWAGVSFFTYDLGRTEGHQAQLSAITQLRDIRASIMALNATIADNWLATEKFQADNLLEKSFHDSVKQHISTLEQTISQQKSQINLYKRILTPTTVDADIRIERIDLAAADTQNPEINLVLSQIKPNPKIIAGEIQVNLSGQKNGEDITLSLSKVTSLGDDYPIRFKFKHLQEFRAILNLPNNFKPSAINVIVKLNSPDGQRITRRTFKWSQL